MAHGVEERAISFSCASSRPDGHRPSCPEHIDWPAAEDVAGELGEYEIIDITFRGPREVDD
jgi:hypothetical protein